MRETGTGQQVAQLHDRYDDYDDDDYGNDDDDGDILCAALQTVVIWATWGPGFVHIYTHTHTHTHTPKHTHSVPFHFTA